MAVSLPDFRALPLALAVCLSVSAAQAASPRSIAPKDPAADRTLTIDADSADVNTQSNHLVLKKVTVSQTGTRIQASEAEGSGPEMSFANSRWEFRGDVRIVFEGGTLDADQATVTFKGNRIARAQATGEPAQFEQKLPNAPRPAQGHAGNIDYEIPEGRVTLTKGYWFTDGRNEMRSESAPLVYSLRDRRLQSSGSPVAPAPDTDPNAGGNKAGGRIHFTIRPDDEDGAAAEPAKP